MKENQKQRHQQKKQTQPTRTQNNWPEPWQKKLKYLLHKKSSIIKMIESDLLLRREKARNIKQLSLSSWRCIGKRREYSDRYIGTVSLPWPRWPISDPRVPKLRFAASPVWHYVFCGFSEISSILETPFFAKTRRDAKKHKNDDGCGARNIFWPFFPKPRFWPSSCKFDTDNVKNPFSPQFWAFLHIAKKKPVSHPIQPRSTCHM